MQALCGEISSYLSRGESLRLDMAALQKKISMDQLLSVLLNVYRALLVPGLRRRARCTPSWPEYEVQDRQKLTQIN